MDDQRMMTAPTFLEIMARWQPHLALTDERMIDAPSLRAERLTFRERLSAAFDLLAALDEATGPAREQLMQQLSNVLHVAILCPTLRMSERQLDTLMMTISELDHEATRAIPDVARFCQRARLVADIILLACDLVTMGGST